MSVIFVKQIKALKNGKVEQVVRFNHLTNTLYHQNRSKDIEMDNTAFLEMLEKTIDVGKERGFEVIVNNVAEGSKWI